MYEKRVIDYLLKVVRDTDGLSPVEKLVIEARLEHTPTPQEITAALEELRVKGEVYREWMMFSIDVCAVIEHPDEENEIRDLLSESCNQITAVLGGREPAVFLQGPNQRKVLHAET